eukprot:8000156-Alexandrium_andersonii.AAC.1
MSNRCRARLRVRHDMGLEEQKKLTARVVLRVRTNVRSLDPHSVTLARTASCTRSKPSKTTIPRSLKGAPTGDWRKMTCALSLPPSKAT